MMSVSANMQQNLLTDEAIERVKRAANQKFMAEARRVMQELIDDGVPFTTDDIWKRLEGREDLMTTDNRAMGAVVRPFKKRGIIEFVGYVPTSRPESHGRPISQWKAKNEQ